MSAWKKEDLRNIIEEDDLHIAPFREDGETYGTPTWIWCVSVDGELYVRAYNGQNSSWYQAAMQQGAGRINAAGKKWEVRFEPIDSEELNNKIDDAYREKYEGHQYLPPMIGNGPRSATVRISLRD